MARIIVVEDDDLLSDLLLDILTPQGHLLSVVENGNDAIKAITDAGPDLVLLDCGLPGQSGLMILRELRASPTLSHTRVLMLTARRSDWHTEMTMEMGADDYLKKPFNAAELVARIECLLAIPERPAAAAAR